jgi:hypothetical protein
MKKFKAGDSVRVIDSMEQLYTTGMRELIGKVCEVEGASELSVTLKGSPFIWMNDSVKMVEKQKVKPKNLWRRIVL